MVCCSALSLTKDREKASAKPALKADQLNLTLSGGADVDLQRSALIINAEGSGGADLHADELWLKPAQPKRTAAQT